MKLPPLLPSNFVPLKRTLSGFLEIEQRVALAAGDLRGAQLEAFRVGRGEGAGGRARDLRPFDRRVRALPELDRRRGRSLERTAIDPKALDGLDVQASRPDLGILLRQPDEAQVVERDFLES